MIFWSSCFVIFRSVYEGSSIRFLTCPEIPFSWRSYMSKRKDYSSSVLFYRSNVNRWFSKSDLIFSFFHRLPRPNEVSEYRSMWCCVRIQNHFRRATWYDGSQSIRLRDVISEHVRDAVVELLGWQSQVTIPSYQKKLNWFHPFFMSQSEVFLTFCRPNIQVNIWNKIVGHFFYEIFQFFDGSSVDFSIIRSCLPSSSVSIFLRFSNSFCIRLHILRFRFKFLNIIPYDVLESYWFQMQLHSFR